MHSILITAAHSSRGILAAACLLLFLAISDTSLASPLEGSTIHALRESIVLTQEELDWLAEQHIVQVRYGQWPPFMMSGDTPTGISIDFLNVISEIHGIRFNYLDEAEYSWTETLDSIRMKSGVDLIPAIQPTESRAETMLFTEAYQSLPWVIVTHTNAPFISSADDLQDMRVAVQQRFILQHQLEERHPELGLDIITTSTPTLDSLRAVATGQADATINALPVVTYFLEGYGMTNLQVAAPAGFPDLELAMAVREDWPELASIINKTLQAMNHKDMTAIRNKWLSVDVEYVLNPALVIRIATVAGVCILLLFSLFLFWNSSLKKQVTERTAELNNELAERQQTTLLLKEREAHLSILFEQAADAIFVSSMGGRLIQVNDQACHSTGFDREQLLGMNVVEVDAEMNRIPDLEAFFAGLEPGAPVTIESRHKRKDGSTFPVEIRICLLSGTVEPQFLGIARDITHRKEAEQTLAITRRYLANIIDSMPSMIIGIDTRCMVTQWNTAAHRETGISPEQAKDRELYHLIPFMTPEMDRMQEAMNRNREPFVFRRSFRQDGMTRYQDVMFYPLTSQEIEGAVIRIDDVSETVRLEEMMVQNEKMLSIGGLAAGMAHEINNPLAAILGNCKNLERRLFQDMRTNKNAAARLGLSLQGIRSYMGLRGIDTILDSIQDSAIRAARIVSNMLSFSRKSPKQFTDHDLPRLLDKTLDLAANDYDLKRQYDFRKIHIVRSYAPDLPQVCCEGNEMQQVFFNLIKNAAEAMAEKEYDLDRPTLTLNVYREESMVVVEVEDNGPGMDSLKRKRVLEPFFTTKHSGTGTSTGTGLGLSVSYYIVTDQHNGQMEVNSTPGQGTQFVVRLPIRQQA